MQQLHNQFLNQKISHHFQIIEGPIEETISDIKIYIKDYLDIDYSTNSKYQEFIFDNLLVENIRSIIKSASLKIKDQETAIFVIACQNINIQAQNAFLKLAEESHSNKIIFLVMPDTSNLLPTLKSRAIISNNSKTKSKDPYCFLNSINSFEDLKKTSPKDRINVIKEILDQKDNGSVTTNDIKKILDDILMNLRNDINNNPITISNKIKKINQVSFYINQNGSSIKNILEFVFLSF